jgi:2-hydroxychromene-2-carboxylate isomerase
LLALRMCTAVDDAGERRRLFVTLVKACWEDGADLSDAATLGRLADGAGFDGQALLAAAVTPEIKHSLVEATARAAADGIFGVPTFRLGDELFWGGDRVDALLWRLNGGAIDEADLQAFLAREPLATRKR